MKKITEERFILYFIFLFGFISAENRYSESCSAEAEYCSVVSDKKFLFYDVNPPEGFNLRRDVYMRFAIMLAERKKTRANWNLVLPPWYRLYHWKSDDNKPKPWAAFFDMESLKSYAPVVELYEVFELGKLEIDVLYVLLNYPFDETFQDRWQIINENCQYIDGFWGYSNISAKEIVCVKFQGSIAKLLDLIDLHPNDRKIMFAHGEIPLHEIYGSKAYWQCRKSMKYNSELINIAQRYIESILNCMHQKCKNYMAVHWRRQDFINTGRVPSIEGTAKQIDIAMRDNMADYKSVFVATDGTTNELNKLERELSILGYKMYYFEPDLFVLQKHQDGGIAIIEQIICSKAAFFIGSHESTFSFRIQEEREILGFDSSTSFNRLCPDNEKDCEKPSIWKIVH